ncbi:MFS transporter [Paenibacillus sp. L3-i20]|uniref:MFS transporter n=1 Tax=Paenibacillus sp. L3-i20 TaxID=2905833 RepID=UPI001EDFD179|nr:MFS transporter [Paenibacillus sp. L3-i20]GKU76657.1 hypothetical protein L3i20_v210540 [Paenibacillus sp. L3-i20]
MGSRTSALTRPVLLGCVFLSIFGEVLLSPFYPQFFAKVFGVEDLTYTGFYILVCRLTVVLISPLWGLLSRKFAVQHLLLVGQAGTAICTAMMALAGSVEQFLVITIALLVFKSSYMFVYPLLVEAAGVGKMALSTGSYHVAYHMAIILSSLAGAAMFSMEKPLLLFFWIAATDVLQFLFCWFIWRGIRRKRTGRDLLSTAEVAATSESNSGSGKLRRMILILASTLLAFHLAIHMIRPYFTVYVEQHLQLTLVAGTALYLIPNGMAVLCFFAVQRLTTERRLSMVLTCALPLLAVSLVLQGIDGGLTLMIVSRCLFGIGLAIAQASMELLLFKSSETGRMHVNYSMAMVFQNGGQLLAPLTASLLLVPFGGETLFFVSASICLLCLLLLWFALFRRKMIWRQPVATSSK